MQTNSFKQHIQQVLKTDHRLWYLDDETKATELNQILLIELAQHYDEKVLALLFADQKCRAKFFVQVGENYIFKSNDFQFFLEEYKVDNSYTQYKNRIGLSDGRRFLKDTQDVVLNFPFKDAILEGGQSTEEGQDNYFEYDQKVTATNQKKGYRENQYNQKQAKRREIFFNEILAADEIDRLRDEKALVNWKRFSKDGQEAVSAIARDENGVIRENLIIKGNNYLGLHSLKKQFAGKVKLIYIDPPYNTGNDGFKYNDNFNHSTWLTFMKNRLEVARQLLRDDGVIFVQCDDNEQAYLKVLMDEVFGRENFIIDVIWKSRNSISNDAVISLNHNHTLLYMKNYSQLNKSDLRIGNFRLEVDDKGYSNTDSDSRGDWKAVHIEISGVNISKGLIYLITDNFGNHYLPKENSCWRFSKTTFEKLRADNRIIFDENGQKKPRYKQFKNETLKTLNSIWDDVGTTTKGTKHLKELLGSNRFNNPKPEALLQRIIEISTQPNDMVLDYHLGSGTTAAVAHKMGRQYIGIEQMDYIEDIAVERLKKVIGSASSPTGEQGGISKAVKWQGGGSFIYCELAKWNEHAKAQILACENLEELKTFFGELVEKYFLNYNLKIREFSEKVMHEANFINLPLAKQQAMFSTMLDLNQMSVCRSEMGDGKFGISEEDRGMTEAFYGKDI